MNGTPSTKTDRPAARAEILKGFRPDFLSGNRPPARSPAIAVLLFGGLLNPGGWLVLWAIGGIPPLLEEGPLDLLRLTALFYTLPCLVMASMALRLRRRGASVSRAVLMGFLTAIWVGIACIALLMIATALTANPAARMWTRLPGMIAVGLSFAPLYGLVIGLPAALTCWAVLRLASRREG